MVSLPNGSGSVRQLGAQGRGERPQAERSCSSKERILDAYNEGETFRNAGSCRMARHTSAVTSSDSIISRHGLTAFWQNSEKIRYNLANIQQHSGKICEQVGKPREVFLNFFSAFSVGHFPAKLAWSFLISLSSPSRRKKRERCKGVHCGDLGESFHMSI